MTPKLRFAPSPTGMMHVGNARTALLNWLFARKNKGHFILRFDDTDLARSKSDYATAMVDDLKWLEWHYDEVFYQSDRLNRYQEAAHRLKDKDLLYPCYETPEELSFKRTMQRSQGKPPLYDRAALTLTASQKEAYISEGRKPHWRFKLTGETITWHDMAHGPISIDTSSLSDPILIREDGSPIYTLSSVVDDLDYDITHILRGNDHITNTGIQMMLASALRPEKSFPLCGHFPWMLAQDGGPLSKRLGSLSIQDLRHQGLEALTLSCYLARLGTCDDIVPCALEELIDQFDVSHYALSSPKFSQDDLERLNAKLMHHLPYDAIAHRSSVLNEDLWTVLKANITKFQDIDPLIKIIQGPLTPLIEDASYIKTALELLPPTPWHEDTWTIWTNALKKATQRKGKDLFMPLRLALTAQEHGPEMKKLLPLLSVERVVKRLQGHVA